MIELTDLTASYGAPVDALSHVTARFEPGVHLLLGPNGAGKTTLLRVMAGELRPREGCCVIDGVGTSHHTPHTLQRFFMLTDSTSFPLDTVQQMARRHGVFYPRYDAETLSQALDGFGQQPTASLASLSLGNRRKAQLAYALALDTDYLLLDEPTNGLDITSKDALLRLLAEAARPDKTILVATHNIHDLRPMFDSVTILDHGRLVLQASISSLIDRIAFVTDPMRHPEALYAETDLGGCHQIVPLEAAGRPTEVDLLMLYRAALSPQGEQLRAFLTDNTPTPQ